MMGAISAKEAAERWGISQRRVAILCSEGRVPGAKRFANAWMIPAEAGKPADARVRDDAQHSTGQIKPFIKWAGGKGQLLGQISAAYPKELGKSITKYAEPFIGGGAVLFDILSRYDFDEVYISDVNRELVGIYRSIRDEPEQLIQHLSRYQGEFIPLDDEGRKSYFYRKRAKFNDLKSYEEESARVEASALFIFLNKTCFNGLYRVNSSNEFNVPCGKYRNPLLCDAENIRSVSSRMQNVEVVCGGFRESSDFIDENTFAYFDPPYRPLTVTSSFTSYTEFPFGDREQEGLASYARELSDRGAWVMLSNSDPKNADPDDDFFDDLYAGFNISRVHANRMINSDGGGRGKITELLITNYDHPVPEQTALDRIREEGDRRIPQLPSCLRLLEDAEVLVHGQEEVRPGVLCQVAVALAVPFPLDDVLLQQEPLFGKADHHPVGDRHVMTPVMRVAYQCGAERAGPQDPVALPNRFAELGEEQGAIVEIREIAADARRVANDVHVRGGAGDQLRGSRGEADGCSRTGGGRVAIGFIGPSSIASRFLMSPTYVLCPVLGSPSVTDIGRSNLSPVIVIAPGLMSTDMEFLPSRRHSTGVVPPPTIGSRTASPSREHLRITSRTRSGGQFPLYCGAWEAHAPLLSRSSRRSSSGA